MTDKKVKASNMIGYSTVAKITKKNSNVISSQSGQGHNYMGIVKVIWKIFLFGLCCVKCNNVNEKHVDNSNQISQFTEFCDLF